MMYTIENNGDHLLVRFNNDFDYATIQTILFLELKLPEYNQMNDIWLIGDHHANLHIDELNAIVNDVLILYSEGASRTKTAFVVDQGLTGAIIKEWANAAKNRVPYQMQLFQTLDEAREWLGVNGGKVA